MCPDEEPLALLDPEPVPTVAATDDPMLADILAGDRHTPVAKNVLPAKHALPVGWIAGSTVAVVGVVGIVAFSLAAPAATPPAFADWTPEPNPNVTTAQKQQIYDGCASLIQDRVIVNEMGQSISSRGATSVIVDKRGSYEAMLVGSNAMWGFCSNLTIDGHLAGTIEQNYADPHWVVPTGDIAILGDQTTLVFGNGDIPAFEIAFGRTGSDVTKVQVVTKQGVVVDSSLSHGFWLVYGPIGSDTTVVTGSSGFSSYIVTRADGTVVTMQASAVAGLGQACYGNGPTPAALACAPENTDVQTAAVYQASAGNSSAGPSSDGAPSPRPSIDGWSVILVPVTPVAPPGEHIMTLTCSFNTDVGPGCTNNVLQHDGSGGLNYYTGYEMSSAAAAELHLDSGPVTLDCIADDPNLVLTCFIPGSTKPR